jgi:anti-anti-sigma regulatory factor
MFRITEQQAGGRIVLKLEGRLSAALVPELDACWRALAKENDERTIWLDLSHVDLVDMAAQQQLTRMHRAGVRFVTKSCLIRELVREMLECR